MKKATLLLVSVCIALSVLGANETYYQKMEETLATLSSSETLEELQVVANQFSTIAKAESKEWLPLYYEAQCYIMMSFMDNSGATSKDAWLDQAESAIGKMLELAPQESEAYALKSFYHTGRLVVNPPQRAQTTALLVDASINKSLSLDPNNPRAKFMRLSNAIGTARFFGSDTTPFCEDALELLEEWDSFKPKSAIHPSWGKSEVEGIVNECGK